MSQPPAYNRSFSFSNFQAQNPSAALPGSSIEQELNNVKATLDAILANLKLVQRDDGAIANASVGLDQLSAQVPVGFNAPVVWTTGTPFTGGSSTVFQGSGFYQCETTHISGVFATDLANGLWELIVNLAAVPLVAAAQIAVTPSGSLTSNVQTSLQALDTGKAPTSHTHVSSAISDSTTVGRALLTAPDVATQNALLGTTTLGFQPGNIKETAGILLESGWYWCDGSNKNRVTDAPLFNAITIQQSGVTTSGSAAVTGLSDTSNMSPGMPMSGIGVQASTVVQSVDSSTQVTMSANATSSATTPLVFAPYGVGDGTTTFGIPNRAYVAVGRDNASGSASNITQVSTTINLTSGSNSATVGSATGLFVGMFVSHPKVPIGTKINAISSTTLTLSNNASATVTASAARFSPLLDAQTLGAVGGALSQSQTLVAANVPPITSSGTFAVSPGSIISNPGGGITTFSTNGGTGFVGQAWTTGATIINTTSPTASGSVTSTGTTSTPFKVETVQPTIVTNYIIKR